RPLPPLTVRTQRPPFPAPATAAPPAEGALASILVPRSASCFAQVVAEGLATRGVVADDLVAGAADGPPVESRGRSGGFRARLVVLGASHSRTPPATGRLSVRRVSTTTSCKPSVTLSPSAFV